MAQRPRCQGSQAVSLSVSGAIHANLASKANSRRFIRPGLIIKSKPAMEFVAAAEKVISTLPTLWEGPVALYADVFYKNRRPDLDVSLLMDVLQGRIYQNDRQVEEIVATKHWDKLDPRVEWEVKTL